ncbi:MAG: hypothetical protein ACLULK_03570 [Anaerovoracaceae bacterium]
MLRKINNVLRTAVIATCVAVVTIKLIEENKKDKDSGEAADGDDFQKEEFDDIW